MPRRKVRNIIETILDKTNEELVQFMLRFAEDLEMIPQFAGEDVEIFITPRAYGRLYGVQNELKSVLTLEKTSNDVVGFFGGIVCKSPVWVRQEQRNLEGLPEGVIEYRVWEVTE